MTAVATPSSPEPTTDAAASSHNVVYWDFKILIDYACPLCRREAEMLRRLDGGRGRLAFEDITAADFDPATYGCTMDDVMGSIHGVEPDGTIVTGVEVFRRAYATVGLGWLLKPTELPGLRQLSDAGYRWFARNRYRIGRLFGGRDASCDCSGNDNACKI